MVIGVYLERACNREVQGVGRECSFLVLMNLINNKGNFEFYVSFMFQIGINRWKRRYFCFLVSF